MPTYVRVSARRQVAGFTYPSRSYRVDFSFEDEQLELVSLLDGATIAWAIVSVVTPFDDSAAELSLGVEADPEAVFATTDIDPTIEANWRTWTPYVTSELTSAQLTVNAGTSTQGAGFVILHVINAEGGGTDDSDSGAGTDPIVGYAYVETFEPSSGDSTVTLANRPDVDPRKHLVARNGRIMVAGANADYTLSGDVVTFARAFGTGEIVHVKYHAEGA